MTNDELRRTFIGVALLALPVQAARAQSCDIEVGAGSTVTLNNDLTVNCITVHGTLNIGGRLTLDGDGPSCVSDQSTVNGTVNLTGSSSKLTFSRCSHTVSGSGQIVGHHDDAEIGIPAGITLTNSATISGALTVKGAGTFLNQGSVNANVDGGVLLITADTVDDSAGTNRWVCSTANAVLRFTDPGGASIGTFGPMAGEFVLSAAGVIELNTALTTDGRLKISAGLVDVNADLTMGSEGNPLDMTGGTIAVSPGKTFVHH